MTTSTILCLRLRPLNNRCRMSCTRWLRISSLNLLHMPCTFRYPDILILCTPPDLLCFQLVVDNRRVAFVRFVRIFAARRLAQITRHTLILTSHPSSPTHVVPKRKTRLRVVVLDTLSPMVNVVVRCIVGKNERHPRPNVAAVVVDSLERCERVKDARRRRWHDANHASQATANHVHQDAFQRMIIQCAKRKVVCQAVVHAVNVSIQPAICVHPTMPPILPRVQDEECERDFDANDFLALPNCRRCWIPRQNQNANRHHHLHRVLHHYCFENLSKRDPVWGSFRLRRVDSMTCEKAGKHPRTNVQHGCIRPIRKNGNFSG